MQTLFESDNITFIIKVLDDGNFPFIHNGDEIRIGDKDFFGLKWTIYNFFYNKIVVIKAQIYS